ncbi:hypothetical protein [Microbacterium sp. CJ88]|uniref:hypothetical protein n=1 Tax=Microbacterium sp. CJ88 TaxID=3445672 RepID=UPI003F65514D
MSTDGGTRRAHARRRRGRAFLGAFAIVLGALAVVGLGGAAAGTIQGPRATDVQVDPQAAVAASGSRLIVTTTQSLKKVDASQVTVTPATPFTVDTSGRTVGVRFTLPLHDDTEYTVTVGGIEGVGGGPAASLTETFRTPPIDVYLLRRGQSGDTIFRTDLAGNTAVPVFTDAHIEDFRATANHLVVSVRTAQDRAALVVTDLDGQNPRNLQLPGNGFVTNLQSADKGELIGYTYSDASLTAGSGRESALFTASLKPDAAGDPPSAITVSGDDPRVAEWRFVPDTDSILLLTFDSRLSLTAANGANPVALGSALSIDGIARGSSHAVVLRIDGPAEIDLTDGSEKPLVAPDQNLGKVGGVTPLPGDGAGTVRTIAEVKDNTTLIGTTIAVVGADGKTTPVLEVDATSAVLQTCASPSGRYAAVLIAPDVVSNRYDTYQMPLPGHVETRIIDLTAADPSAAAVSTLTGFDTSWCQVPPR